MRKLRIVVVLAAAGLGLVFSGRVLGQSSFWDSRDAYLGQRLVGDTPRVFALDLLNSKDTFSLDRLVFSVTALSFFFPATNTWFVSFTAKWGFFRFAGGRWRGPF